MIQTHFNTYLSTYIFARAYLFLFINTLLCFENNFVWSLGTRFGIESVQFAFVNTCLPSDFIINYKIPNMNVTDLPIQSAQGAEGGGRNRL